MKPSCIKNVSVNFVPKEPSEEQKTMLITWQSALAFFPTLTLFQRELLNGESFRFEDNRGVFDVSSAKTLPRR